MKNQYSPEIPYHKCVMCLEYNKHKGCVPNIWCSSQLHFIRTGSSKDMLCMTCYALAEWLLRVHGQLCILFASGSTQQCRQHCKVVFKHYVISTGHSKSGWRRESDEGIQCQTTTGSPHHTNDSSSCLVKLFDSQNTVNHLPLVQRQTFQDFAFICVSKHINPSTVS